MELVANVISLIYTQLIFADCVGQHFRKPFIRICYSPRVVGSTLDALTLEQVEEALGYCIVVAVAPSAHWVFQIVSPNKGSPVQTGELRALIGMDQYTTFWLSSPNRHVQRLQHHIGGLSALYRPAHHAAGIEVKHDSQIGKAFHCANVSDVRHPSFVRHAEIELPR